ncbi:hypothetical protein SAMN06265371_105103 [Lutibacter agarilyticus]|uniref:Uncharacterized protein n=1 Tax=Lutibacter agarilyticus TaxID=1109740 RepID=A0A238XAN1_9FLAO|nr:hypothetical protein [Lutibacter agarilyticus]SNR55394.1 hypothetical protein SAMN06265371_105103 [Lutibacter agarilyticus]
MKYLYPFLFLILLIGFSCNSKRTEANQSVIDSLAVNSNRITNTISETLIPAAKKDFEHWQEYNDVDALLISYYNISVSEALSKSEELADLVKLMKDSVRVEAIDKLNVIARFNVLHNEALRLADMATISSITDEEVIDEVGQIIAVFASVNAKINTIYKAIELQNALEVDTEKPIQIEEENSTIESVTMKPRISSKTIKKPSNKPKISSKTKQ